MVEEIASPKQKRSTWIYDLLLILVLVVAGYFRFIGLDWDEGQLLHPDERFLTQVETTIRPVDSLGDYFDTQTSTLNPHNLDFGLFVYGDFPIILVRYLGERFGELGYGQINVIGRQVSALADLLLVFVVYLIGARAYDKRVGLVASIFAACTVMLIQQAHFFTVDSIKNFFMFLAFYFAVVVATDKPPRPPKAEVDGEETPKRSTPSHFKVIPFILFGISLGMAVASKVDAGVVAAMLPLAVFVRFSRMTPEERSQQSLNALYNLVLAALVSLLVFRILQPYAFTGPGFFGLRLEPRWIANLKEIAAQASGDVDWPPSIQWARRPIWFSFQNMVLWGMGLPMAIAAWGGFLWAGWRMLRGEWRRHLLLWGWTGAFFGWQSLKFNPTMRYQLPVYPTLVILGAWALVALWDKAFDRAKVRTALIAFGRGLAILVCVASVGGTFLWALAFSHIYAVSDGRLEASRWIYQDLPGPMTLPIETADGPVNQPLPVAYSQTITSDFPYLTSFIPQSSGTLSELRLKYVLAPVHLRIYDGQNPEVAITDLYQLYDFGVGGVDEPQTLSMEILPPGGLVPGVEYTLDFQLPPGQGRLLLQGALLQTRSVGDSADTPVDLLPDEPRELEAGDLLQFTFSVEQESLAVALDLTFSLEAPYLPADRTLQLALGEDPEITSPLATASQAVPVSPGVSVLTDGVALTLDHPVNLEAGRIYYLRLGVEEEGSALMLRGTAIANETSWDLGLPLRMDGYDGYGGIYQPGLTLNMEWDENRQKLQHYVEVLDSAEYVFISSSRQWASLPRIPERFPLSIAYYRYLLGCPEEKGVEWCYNVAQVGDFQGQLGFELVDVFDTDPAIGSFRINDQPSEEAFTVYDHAKVFVFHKTDAYSHANTAALLGAVDLAHVIRLTPKQATQRTSDLMLSPERLARQQANATWSDLFDTDALFNRYPALAAVLWYVVLSLLGFAVYPLLRAALPGLADRGYPMIRVFGLLLLAYMSWLLASFGLPFSRLVIGLIFLVLVIAGSLVAYKKREEMVAEMRSKWRYFLGVEGLFLAFFLVGLLIRLGNPDLWHPFFGGEKPMDFSYFNAVLRSTIFPPYDPWYAGGYINYYYFGFVYVAALVKFLGIVPAIAYNLILPTLFAMMALGAFSAAWNLYQHWRSRKGEDDAISHLSPWLVGIAAALLLAVLGNLGSLHMIFQGYERLGVVGTFNEDAFFLTKWVWAFRGLVETIKGTSLPYGIGDWYWIPSRVIPEDVITEFPMFTFLYADLHAHLIALPLTLLALGWVLSAFFGQIWRRQEKGRSWWLKAGWIMLAGALVIGALRPTNTWDVFTYLGLAAVALAYVIWRDYQPIKSRWEQFFSAGFLKYAAILVTIGSLVALSFLLYRPFSRWYVQGYSSIEAWTATHTPLSAYLTHWGVFLFVIFFWMVWETRQWMASTPLSSLRKLEPYSALLLALGIIFLAIILVLQFYLDVYVAFLVLPLAVWAAVLILRPGQPDAKRAVLFMVGTALTLSLMVEVVRVEGDIGRMNTVFKFYLQAWTLLAVSAAAAFAWTLAEIRSWSQSWRAVWQLGLLALVASAALFPFLATTAKVTDRMAPDAPHTLNGMSYMQYAHYGTYGGVILDLSLDYRAIRWMQENVDGLPVIVEANNPQYQWGSRFTIYTGNPGVVGWEWHQIQQRQYVPGNDVTGRVAEIRAFYETEDADVARSFLQKYQVEYVVFGDLERATYPGPGLDKFAALDGVLWREVYRDGTMIIYQVLPQVLSAK